MDKKGNKILYYLLCFASIFFLSLFFVYSHDDWAWGSIVGLDRLGVYFDGHNGRYLGNIIEMLITRSPLLRSILVSFVTTGILYLLNSLVSNNEQHSILAPFLIIFMPSAIMRQTIAWSAGFSNYVVSVFLVLIFINYNKKLLQEMPISKVKDAVLLSILGFCSVLLMEHFTFYTLVLGGAALVFIYIKYKTCSLQHLMYFLSAIAGTILMLRNSAYSAIAHNTDSYRTVASSLHQLGVVAHDNFVHNILPYGFTNNTILIMFLGAGIMHAISSRTFLQKKIPLTFYSLSIITLTIPLFFVTPIGPRCFFGTYIFFICIIMELFKDLSKWKGERAILALIILAGYLHLLFVFHANYTADKVRVTQARQQSQISSSVVISDLPYPKYVWLGSPTDDLWEYRFKLFYGIDEKVDIIVVPYVDKNS